MTIKRNRLLLVLPLFSFFLMSCWDNFEERSYYTANVSSFSFKSHDTCPGIEKYTFLINQLEGLTEDTTTGKIYNPDSLPYGRVVNTLLPVITFQSTNGKIYMNDSLWESTDSIDFTKTVILKNTSYDGLYTKRYSIHLNVHQVKPDSMQLLPQSHELPVAAAKSHIVEKSGLLYNYILSDAGVLQLLTSADTCRTWTQQNISGLPAGAQPESVCLFGNEMFALSGSVLYKSTNGYQWSEVHATCNGLPVTFLNLYGELKRKYITDTTPYNLVGLIRNASGKSCFARSADGTDWQTGEEIPQGFPVSDFSLIRSAAVTGVQYWTIANGVDADGKFTPTVWATEDGLSWVLINDGLVKYNSLKPRKNATLFRYSGQLISLGGTDENGNFYQDLMVSPDQGRTWREAKDEWAFNTSVKGVSGMGAYVIHVADAVNDKDREFIWLTGGKTKDGASKQVWKAYENSMVFARR